MTNPIHPYDRVSQWTPLSKKEKKKGKTMLEGANNKLIVNKRVEVSIYDIYEVSITRLSQLLFEQWCHHAEICNYQMQPYPR
jgi:hypothetical protein